MARDVESLVLQMSADLRRFEKSMAGMRATADRRLNEVEKRAVQADRNLSRTMGRAGENMTSELRSSLSGVAGVLAAAFSVDAIKGLADSYTQMQNRLKTTGLEATALADQFAALNKVADDSRSPIEAVVATYARLRLATEGMGISNERITRTTEILSKALKSSGATAGEATAALLQFGQAIGAGALQGDELRSIRENAPAVARAIAEEFGVTVGGLKKLGEEGKLTSERVLNAVLASGEAIDAVFAKTDATVGDALTNLQNRLTTYIGLTDESTSATDRARQAINALADNLDTLALVVGAVATVTAGRFLLSMTAATGAMIAGTLESVRYQAALAGLATRGAGVTATTITATGATVAFTGAQTASSTATVIATGAMARFNAMVAANPIGAAVIAVAALTAGIVYLGNQLEITGTATRDVTAANTALEKATEAYSEAARAAAIATGEEARVSREVAAAKRDEAVAKRDAAQATLANAAAVIALIQAEASRQLDLERRAPIRGDRPGSVRTIGRAERQRLADAEASAAESSAAIADANAAIAEADEALRRRPSASPAAATSGGAGGGGRGADNADQIARARAALALEEDLARARATGDAAAIKAAEERQELARLTQQYEAAGYADAASRAVGHLALLNAAEKLVEDRAAAEEEVDRILADRERQLQREAEHAQLMSDQLLDRLGYELELARLAGDEGAIRAAERRLFIEERTLEILRLRLALTQEEAAAMASAEWSDLEGAASDGKLRDEFRQSFREGIRAAIDGDLGGFFEGLADRFTDRMLDNLADDLFDLLSSAAKGMFSQGDGGGGNWLAAIGRAVFGGLPGRASGGPVSAGMPYIVGEKRPEVFVPNVSGSIIPSVNTAIGQANRVRAGAAQPLIVRIVPNDDRFDAYVDGRAGPLAVQAAATAYGTTRNDQSRAQRRARQRFV